MLPSRHIFLYTTGRPWSTVSARHDPLQCCGGFRYLFLATMMPLSAMYEPLTPKENSMLYRSLYSLFPSDASLRPEPVTKRLVCFPGRPIFPLPMPFNSRYLFTEDQALGRCRQVGHLVPHLASAAAVDDSRWRPVIWHQLRRYQKARSARDAFAPEQ